MKSSSGTGFSAQDATASKRVPETLPPRPLCAGLLESLSLLYERLKPVPRFALLFALTSAAFAQNTPLPTGEAVLDRFVEATGGKDAYLKHTSEIQTGTLDYPALGVKAPVTRYSAPPDQYLLSMEMPGVGKVDTGVSNGIAWSNSAIAGPRVLEGQEKALALREAKFNGVVNWRQTIAKAENKGIEPVDGDDCYRIVLTPKEGREETRYFSVKSGLLVKASTIAATQVGDIPVEMRYTGYKQFNGVLFPVTVTQVAAGQEFSVTIQNIENDKPIPAEKFALPADIKALLNKPK
jgi:hypothetical protein